MPRDRYEPVRPAPDRLPSPEVPRGGRGASGTHAGRSHERPTPQEALASRLELPREDRREVVFLDQERFSLRGSEVRTLAAAGAFRVVPARDLSDREGDVRALADAGLVRTHPHTLNGERSELVTLTRKGQRLLEQHQKPHPNEPRQHYHAGLVKPRELSHDAQLYGLYLDAAERIHADGGDVQRVVLDYELKREYQRFLQQPNHEERNSSGRPARSRDEVSAWAAAHQLTTVNGRVQLPDVRVEYIDADGRERVEDLELATHHYTNRQMAGKRAAGFTMRGSSAGRLQARTGGRLRPDLAAKVVS